MSASELLKESRKRNGNLAQRKVADLPIERVTVASPLVVGRGRGSAKRYGVLFACFSIRTVDVEMAYSRETEVFLNALHRFISRREQPEENPVGQRRKFRFYAELKQSRQNIYSGELGLLQYPGNALFSAQKQFVTTNRPSRAHPEGWLLRLVLIPKGDCNHLV